MKPSFYCSPLLSCLSQLSRYLHPWSCKYKHTCVCLALNTRISYIHTHRGTQLMLGMEYSSHLYWRMLPTVTWATYSRSTQLPTAPARCATLNLQCSEASRIPILRQKTPRLLQMRFPKKHPIPSLVSKTSKEVHPSWCTLSYFLSI